MHDISAEEVGDSRSGVTKLLAEPTFLQRLEYRIADRSSPGLPQNKATIALHTVSSIAAAFLRYGKYLGTFL